MNKKFLSAILFGALAVTSTGSFVSCKDYDDDIDNLQTQINGLASAKDLSDKVSTLQSAISSAQTAAEAKAAAAQVVADAAKAAADKAGADAADVKKALDAAVADLEAKGATKEELEAAKAVAAEAAAAAQKAGEDAAAAVKEVEAKLDAAVEAADAKVAEAAAAAAAAQKAVDELAAGAASQADLDAVKAAAAAAQAAADKAQATADEAKAAAAENKAALAEAATKAEVAAVAAEVAANAAAIEAKADAETVEALAARVKALEEAIPGLAGEESVKALAALATTLKGDVEGMATKLGVISKRLTSVVFAPKTYINGIEAIKFINLVYPDWSTDPAKWLANEANYKINNNQVYHQVEDFGAEVTYMVSPDGVTEKGIKMDELKFVLNDAKNTRAGVAGAGDVELTFLKEDLEVKNGKLHGYVKKTFKNNKDRLPQASEHGYAIYEQDANGNWYISRYELSAPKDESLIVASLKAPIADDLKTEEEKGQEVAVYSDWTRVNEKTGTPYIHRAGSYWWDEHFSRYTDVYKDKKFGQDDYRADENIIKDNDKKQGPDAVYDYRASNIGYIIPAVYNQPLNLLSLVTVCVDGEVINDYARYGLTFEFNMLDYVLLNQNATKEADKTNQKDFATLAEDGITLTSRAENGLTDNKNALGHTPLIQAVLRDTKNGNAVVDVQYFKIKWVEKAQETNPWDKPFEKLAPFMCSGWDGSNSWNPGHMGNGYYENYQVYITEDEMNDFCARIITGGIKVDDFKQQYPFTSDIYLGTLTDEVKADLMKTLDNNQNMYDITVDGWKTYTSIGHAYWAEDIEEYIGGATLTDNILLNYTFINPRNDENWDGKEQRTEKAKDEASFSKEGFFWFTSQDGTNRIFVPVKINVVKHEYEYAVTKEPAQWNAAQDTRTMNPALRSNAVYGYNGTIVTTQMIGSLPAGYYKTLQNGVKPIPAINELLKEYYVNEDEEKVYDNNVTSSIVFDDAKFNELPVLKTDKKYNDNGVVDNNGSKKNTSWYVKYVNGKCLLCNGYKKNVNDNDEQWKEELVAAVIDEVGNIYLTDKASESKGEEYVPGSKQPNKAALALVGQNVPVKVVASKCNDVDTYKYAINFLAPLKFKNLNDVLHVYDITDGGSHATFSIGTICLEEIFDTNKRAIYIVQPVKPEEPVAPVKSDFLMAGVDENSLEGEAAIALFTAAQKEFKEVVMPAYTKQYEAYLKADKAYSNQTNQDLQDWYGIQDLVVDLDGAKTDLLTGKFDTNLKDITLADNTTKKYSLKMVDINGDETTVPGEMVGIRFDNFEDNSIHQDINIRIPVKVDTKWQKDTTLKGEIQVTIHSTIPASNK